MVNRFWLYNPCYKCVVGFTKPKEASEKYIHYGNKMSLHVEATGDCFLVLSSSLVLVLKKTFYVLKFSKKLILVSKLIPLGYSFQFLEEPFRSCYKFELVGDGILSNDFFILIYLTITAIMQHKFMLV